jgi:RNA polymerase sigma-70 factor (sigma-E family)
MRLPTAGGLLGVTNLGVLSNGRARDDDPADTSSRAGEVSALFDAHWLEMVRLALVNVGDRASAEDVAAEAFTALFRRWENLRDKENPVRYLRSTVLNMSRKLLRRRGIARRYSPPHEPPGWSAESEVVLSEERRAVLRALMTLPLRRRQVLILRFYLNLSYAEIAKTLGVREGTVRTAVSRGLAALGRILEESS